jgi:Ran GTPase-activating protein (RanGAP) involved in mRNA processing and transport
MGMVSVPPAHLGRTVRTLATMSSLTGLDLSNNSIRLAGAEALAPHLAKMTWLCDLDISSSMLGPAGLYLIARSLKHLTALRALSMVDVVGSKCAGEAWGEVFAALAGIAGLRDLQLGQNRFPSSTIAEHIAPNMTGLTALETLDFHDCSMSRVRFISCLFSHNAPLCECQSS